MAEGTVRENHDPGLTLVDSYYYQIERVRLAGRLLMFASDFQSLDDTGKLFYLHKDKYKSQCFILKKYDLSMRGKIPQNKIYSLRKGRRSVFINNYEYPLRCNPDAEYFRQLKCVGKRFKRSFPGTGRASFAGGCRNEGVFRSRDGVLPQSSVLGRQTAPDDGRDAACAAGFAGKI